LTTSISPLSYCTQTNKMPVLFDESVTNENLATEDDGKRTNKRKYQGSPQQQPRKKLRSIDEDGDSAIHTAPPTYQGDDPSSRTIVFGDEAGDSEKEAIEKEKVTPKQ
jgi:hypothetical protein